MKTVLAAVAGIGASVLLVSGAVAAASVFVKPDAPHAFGTIDAPLWTFTPVYLSRQGQTAAEIMAANSGRPAAVQTASSSSASLAPPTEGAIEPSFSEEHMAWCAERYRSYRADDNTYRSYSGVMKACHSPFESAPVAVSEEVAGAIVADAPWTDAAAAWCKARYRSYRESDNSYQPYGGARRPCLPPSEIASAAP